MKFPKHFLPIILSVEILIFCFYTMRGSHGILAIMAMREKNHVLEREIQLLKQEIDNLTSEIDNWKNYPFFQEQYAREHLQMSQQGDEIYLI